MDGMNPIVALMVRHALTSLAGMLVAHGTINSSMTEQFVAGGLFFASIAWSWWQKEGQKGLLATLARAKGIVSVDATKTEAANAATAVAKGAQANGL